MLSRHGMAPSSVVSLPPILWEERERAIVLNQHIIRFNRAEYAIVWALYQQGERWQRGEAPRLLPREELAAQAHLPLDKLYRTICRASHKLEPHDWMIGAIYSWGYGLFSIHEVGIGAARLRPVP